MSEYESHSISMHIVNLIMNLQVKKLKNKLIFIRFKNSEYEDNKYDKIRE